MAVTSTGPRETSGQEHSDLAHAEFQIQIHFWVELSSRQVNREPGDGRHKHGSHHVNDGSHHIVRTEDTGQDRQGGKRRQTEELMGSEQKLGSGKGTRGGGSVRQQRDVSWKPSKGGESRCGRCIQSCWWSGKARTELGHGLRQHERNGRTPLEWLWWGSSNLCLEPKAPLSGSSDLGGRTERLGASPGSFAKGLISA